MRRNRIILGALASLALFAIPAPAALAGGPLLSGYGGPGAGAQAIIGATLLNGPGGSSGGSSGGGSAGDSSSNGSSVGRGSTSSPTAAGATSGGGSGRVASSAHSAATGAQRAHGGSAQGPHAG